MRYLVDLSRAERRVAASKTQRRNFERSKNENPLDELVIERVLALETPPDSASERGECGAQRGAGPHRGGRLGVVGQVVTADVDRLALSADQLAIDLRLV